MRRSNPYLFPNASLQLLEDVLSTGDLKDVLLLLLLGVGDLAVVKDEGVTVGTALLVGPANALGELGVGVGEEQLDGALAMRT